MNVLMDSVLYKQIINSALYHDDPTFTQAIILFWNYILVSQLFSCLAVPCFPVQIAEAFNTALTAAHTAILVLLVHRGLDRLLGTLPRNHLAQILQTIIVLLSEEQQRAYYNPNGPVEGVMQGHQENSNPPAYSRTDP